MTNSMNQSTEKQHVEATTSAPAVEPEVEARATRRQFTAAYKLRILEKAERCTAAGEIGALLRKEEKRRKTKKNGITI